MTTTPVRSVSKKGVTDGTGAYSDCVTAQKAWIEEWQNRSFSKPNG